MQIKKVNPFLRSPLGVVTTILKPRKYSEMSKSKVKYKYAQDLAEAITPKMGEHYYCVVNGSFVFGDFIEALIVENNWHVKEMSISTLGYNQNNVDSLKNLIDGGFLDKLNILASAEFYGHENGKELGAQTTKLIPYTYEELNGHNQCAFQLGFCDTHMKIVNIETHCGMLVTIHGSANLRSSGNVEHFSIECDEEMHEFNKEIFDALLNKCATIKKPLRKSAMWETINKDE